MRSMKTSGLEEVRAARKRLSRLFGMNRISELDFKYLRQRFDEIEARIVSMDEEQSSDERRFME